jgi:hypothetical protein
MNTPTTEEQNKSLYLKIGIGFFILCLCMICCIIAYFMFSGSSVDGSSSTSGAVDMGADVGVDAGTDM